MVRACAGSKCMAHRGRAPVACRNDGMQPPLEGERRAATVPCSGPGSAVECFPSGRGVTTVEFTAARGVSP
jgi:hypothetical protein